MVRTIAQTQDAARGIEGIIPESWIPGAMLAAGVALVCLVMLRLWAKRRRTQRARDAEEGALSAKERMERLRSKAAVDSPSTAPIERLMVEVQELTRACTAQLDTKAARLERLIEEANATIERLEQANTGAETSPAMRPATGAVTDGQLRTVGFPMDQRVRTRSDAIERTINPTPNEDPLAQRVVNMSMRGMTPVQIAQELGEQVGRVELMLALRRA
jgi:hypothetical protein